MKFEKRQPDATEELKGSAKDAIELSSNTKHNPLKFEQSIRSSAINQTKIVLGAIHKIEKRDAVEHALSESVKSIENAQKYNSEGATHFGGSAMSNAAHAGGVIADNLEGAKLTQESMLAYKEKAKMHITSANLSMDRYYTQPKRIHEIVIPEISDACIALEKVGQSTGDFKECIELLKKLSSAYIKSAEYYSSENYRLFKDCLESYFVTIQKIESLEGKPINEGLDLNVGKVDIWCTRIIQDSLIAKNFEVSIKAAFTFEDLFKSFKGNESLNRKVLERSAELYKRVIERREPSARNFTDADIVLVSLVGISIFGRLEKTKEYEAIMEKAMKNYELAIQHGSYLTKISSTSLLANVAEMISDITMRNMIKWERNASNEYLFEKFITLFNEIHIKNVAHLSADMATMGAISKFGDALRVIGRQNISDELPLKMAEKFNEAAKIATDEAFAKWGVKGWESGLPYWPKATISEKYVDALKDACFAYLIMGQREKSREVFLWAKKKYPNKRYPNTTLSTQTFTKLTKDFKSFEKNLMRD